MTYSNGTQGKIGDVVRLTGQPERYMVIGDRRRDNSAMVIMIATSMRDNDPLVGKTIILPPGYVRNVPAGELTKIGYALITIDEQL
jgi:hypothetical protein